MRHRFLLPLLLLATHAWAVPGDWGACQPLAAGSCASVTDLLPLGTATLSASGSIPANRCVFGATGIICEGATADASETLVTFADPTADRTITFPDATGSVVTTGDTNSITAGMITNITRSIPLPFSAWFDSAAGTISALSTDNGADAQPDLSQSSTVPRITYDVTGGSVDTDEICTAFIVPADYASGGSIVARVKQSGATATQTETWSCRASVDDGAISSANAANAANQTAVQTVTSTPAITWTAGSSIGVCCKQGNASADDSLIILGIEAQYTATE